MQYAMTSFLAALAFAAPLFAGGMNAHIQVNMGHTAIICDADMSPDGKLLATAGGDGLVKLWDCASFREIRSMSCPAGWVRVVRFSTDGGRIAYASENVIRVRSSSDDLGERALNGHASMIKDLAFSPDGKTLVSGDKDGALIVWNLADGRIVKKITLGKEIFDLEFSADGSSLAAAYGDDRAAVLNTSNWKEKGVVKGQYLRHAALSGDGKTVICGAYGKILVADLSGKVRFEQFVGTFKLLKPVPSQNSVCAVTQDGKIVIYDYAEGRIVRETEKLKKTWNDPFVSSAACSFQSGEAVFTESTSFRAVDMNAGAVTRLFPGIARGITDARYLRRTKRLAAVFEHDDRTVVVDLSGPAAKNTVIKASGPMAVFPDETKVAIESTHSLQSYDAATGKAVGEVSQYVYPALRADMSPDGKYAAAACSDGTVWFNPVSDVFAIRKLADLGKEARDIAFSPDGTKLLGCGGTKAVLWNTADEGTAVFAEDAKKSFRRCAYSADGKLAALGAKDGTVSVYPSSGGKPLASAAGGSAVCSLVFSADAKLVISGGLDGVIRVFSASDGALRFSIPGHLGRVDSLDLLPSNRLMSSGSDGVIRVWDLATGTLAGTVFVSSDGCSAIAWDGRYDGTEKALESMHWSAGNEVIPLGDFGASFRAQGLVAKLVGGEVAGGPAAAEAKPDEDAKAGIAAIDVTRRLVGKIHSVKGSEVVVSYAGTGHVSMIKDRYFVIADSGEKIFLESVFPMMASTRCRAEKEPSLRKIKKGMPVFK